MDVQGIVNILNGSGYSIGTGFFTSSNGYILTCYHVLKLIDSIGLNSPVSYTHLDVYKRQAMPYRNFP